MDAANNLTVKKTNMPNTGHDEKPGWIAMGGWPSLQRDSEDLLRFLDQYGNPQKEAEPCFRDGGSMFPTCFSGVQLFYGVATTMLVVGVMWNTKSPG